MSKQTKGPQGPPTMKVKPAVGPNAAGLDHAAVVAQGGAVKKADAEAAIPVTKEG